MGARARRGSRFAIADSRPRVAAAPGRRSRYPFLRAFLHAEEDAARPAAPAGHTIGLAGAGVDHHHHPRLPRPCPRRHLGSQARRPRRLLAGAARGRCRHPSRSAASWPVPCTAATSSAERQAPAGDRRSCSDRRWHAGDARIRRAPCERLNQLPWIGDIPTVTAQVIALNPSNFAATVRARQGDQRAVSPWGCRWWAARAGGPGHRRVVVEVHGAVSSPTSTRRSVCGSDRRGRPRPGPGRRDSGERWR